MKKKLSKVTLTYFICFIISSIFIVIPTYATQVTFDFDSGTTGKYNENNYAYYQAIGSSTLVIESGDITDLLNGSQNGSEFGGNAGYTNKVLVNDNLYMGSTPRTMTVRLSNNAPFTLSKFDYLTCWGTPETVTIKSNKGDAELHSLDGTSFVNTITPNNPANFTNITQLTISASGECLSYVFDNFVVDVKSAPTVTTNETVNPITLTSATIGGNVTSNGGLTVTARGIEYKKNTDTSYTKIAAATAGTGEFNVSLSGLESGTTYDVRAYATNDGGTSYGDVVQFTTLANAATIEATTDMTEGNLDTNSIDVTLSGESFADETLDKANFTLNNAPAGLTVESVSYKSPTECTVNLAFDGTDFDSDKNIGLTISGGGLSGGSALTSTNQLGITATNEPESISISSDGSIIEKAENGEVITVTLSGGTFVNSITPSNWTVSNLPAGVSKGNVTRVSPTEVQITLSGNTAGDYDTDITNVTVACTADEYSDSTGVVGLSANSGVTLTANTEPIVTTDDPVPVAAVASTTATIGGKVTSNGGLTVTARGIEYKKDTDISYMQAPALANGTGAFSVNLTGLQPSTTYNVRSYATNSDGTSYGAVVNFTTTNTNPTISDITDKSTDEDTPITISFIIGDAETAAGSLSISATSNNTTLIPNTNYSYGGSGANRTITITPVENQYSSATITVTVNDGTGGTVQDTFVLTVNPVNDAPILASASPTLTSINEDSTTNSGQTVASFIGVSITDVDSGAVEGIAITGTAIVSGSGTWEYSIGDGGTWHSIDAVAVDSALLLRDTDKVRFVPDGQNAASASITYRAWDQSSGTVGHPGDTSSNGGTSAFSDGTNTATITVTAVNDAPILSVAAPTLTIICADNITNAGQTVASFIGASITDVDNGALKGIAITSVTSGNGAWEYLTDNGGTWTGIGAVAGNSALLLRDTDKIRFVPNGQDPTTATITYRAWDQTSGSTTADTTANGGTTAFSTVTNTASITVTEANYAPILTSCSPVLTAISEDDINNGGQTVASIVGTSITDANTNPVPVGGIAITSVSSGNGAWEYSINNGSTWTAIEAVAGNSALLLRDTDKVRFRPNGQNATTASITYRAWDRTSGAPGDTADTTTNGGTSTFSTATDTASIVISAINDAPILAPATPSLTTITASDTTNLGHTVSAIIAATISDVDTGAQQGIAITSTSVTGENGKWQYSTNNGVSWNDVDTVSSSNALLLSSTDKIRFLPDGQNGTTASITYCAWDQSTGLAGNKVNASSVGGSTSFSTGLNTASITVTETIKPTLVSAVRTDNTHITVTLSENCTGITQANDGGFTVSQTGTPGTTYVVSSIAQGNDASHVVLTVSDMAISAKEGITVKYAADGNGSIQDALANAMATDNIGVVAVGWDTVAPTITTANLSADNSYIDITFNEGIYGANDGIEELTASKLALTFTKNTGTATNVTISSIKKNDSTIEGSASELTGGETTIRVFLNITDTPNGAETIEIKPANASSIYDKAGNAVLISQTTEMKTINDKVAPTFDPATGTLLDTTHKIVTLTFGENVENNLLDLTALKSAITFAADGTNYSALGSNDSVAIVNGKLVITFENALVGNTSKIQIVGSSLKDNHDNVITGSITTNAIVANTAPAAPTAVSATAGNGSATITFTPPVNNGGSTITSYTVTSTPGNITATGNGSPITITGLTNGVAYTFTVTATNAIGTGTASSVSSSVTPTAPYVPPSGGSQPGTTPGPKQEEITVDVTDGKNNTAISETKIERTTEADGTKKDEVEYTADKAQETVEKLKEAGEDTARIVIPDAKDEVSEAQIKIPTTTISVISQGNINLEIDTENARISIPKESMENLNGGLKEDLFFRVVPIKEEQKQQQIIERAKQEEIVKEVAKDSDISVVGRPMTIETNMSQREVDIVLPLKDVKIPIDPKEREEFFSKVGIFIEHSDGEKVLTKGEIVEYKNGVLGIKFRINKFSTFTIIKLNQGEFDEDGNISSNGGYGGPKTFMQDKEIIITLNKDLDKNSLTKENIYVENSKGNKVESILKYNPTSKTITVSPLKYYNTGEAYYLYITDKLLSTAGESIHKKIKYRFNIGTIDLEKAEKLAEYKEVYENKAWTATLNQAMDISKFKNSNIKVYDEECNEIEVVSTIIDNKTIKITPKKGYSKGEKYYLLIDGLISDKGLGLKKTQWIKYTISAPDYNDYGSPKTFMQDKKLSITFNKDLNKSSITKESIYVTDSKGNAVETVLSYNSTEKTVTVTPLKYYNTGEIYQLYITDNLLSTSGKIVSKKIRYSFNIGNIVLDKEAKMGEYLEVLQNKDWTINLNQSMDISKFGSNKIKVYDENCNEIETTITAIDSKTIKVNPKSIYDKGKKYYLVVDGLVSEKGTEQNKNQWIEYTISYN